LYRWEKSGNFAAEDGVNAMKKTGVGILGATGSVGQLLVSRLHKHPWFEIVALAASARSAGKRYSEAVRWLQPEPIPEKIGKMKIHCSGDTLPAEMLFSALDADVAGEIEAEYAAQGKIVISNAKNHRLKPNVPLLMPMVNPEHLSLIRNQQGPGAILTNPNCSTAGLVTALQPLHRALGLEKVHIVTMQALSGAGFPGVSSLEIADNLIPYISGEEEKIETETRKILGQFSGDELQWANFEISAQCNRVNVLDGHTESVYLKTAKPTSAEKLISLWQNYQAEESIRRLPSTPKHAILYYDAPSSPQPRLHRMTENGMAVHIGRLRQHDASQFSFVLLVHNTILGAAGTAIHNAEFYISQRESLFL
jgi:aspartate-semialdehyde dehydrogenase